MSTRDFFKSIEQEKEWRDALQRNKDGLANSAIFLQLWSDGISRDPLACMQLGLCMMMDKPIHIVAPHGSDIPVNMRKVALSIDYFDRDKPKDLERVAGLIGNRIKNQRGKESPL